MTVGKVARFSFGGAAKAKGGVMDVKAIVRRIERDDAVSDRKMMKADEAEDKRMIAKGIREHETQDHGGKHATLKLARGGIARASRAPTRVPMAPPAALPPGPGAMMSPPGALAGTVGAAPPNPVVPQMYGNAAKTRLV